MAHTKREQAAIIVAKGNEIDDLQRQLHEAQEELLVAKPKAESWQRAWQQAQEERDECKDAYSVLRQMELESRRQEKRAKAERDAAIERAEAAEALAETRLNYGLWALRTIKGMLHHGDVVTIVPGRWLTPAEAPKEGD